MSNRFEEKSVAEVIEALSSMWNSLDELQETTLFQNDEDLMDDVGEAIGYIDNLMAALEERYLNQDKE